MIKKEKYRILELEELNNNFKITLHYKDDIYEEEVYAANLLTALSRMIRKIEIDIRKEQILKNTNTNKISKISKEKNEQLDFKKENQLIICNEIEDFLK